LKLTLSGDNLYFKNDEFYLYYLDIPALEKAIDALKQNQFQIEKFTERRFEGNIFASRDNAVIQTTIPYDSGWKVYVDGEEVNYYKTFEALIAFDIPQGGEHTLKIVYSPKEIIVGVIVSLTSLTVFTAVCIFTTRKKFSKS
jgi:uncharacterized membrane protein YfhO